MGKIIRNGIEYSGTFDDATSVNYDNSVSGLKANTVQEGIDELTKGSKGAFPVDNLLSTATDLPLSANQGRVLDEKINSLEECEKYETDYFIAIKSHNIVTVSYKYGANFSISGWGELYLGTLPESWKPEFRYAQYSMARNTQSSATAHINMFINTDGRVTLYNFASGQAFSGYQLYVTITYPVY